MLSDEGKLPVLALDLITSMTLCNVNVMVDSHFKAGICEPLPEMTISVDYGEKC